MSHDEVVPPRWEDVPSDWFQKDEVPASDVRGWLATNADKMVSFHKECIEVHKAEVSYWESLAEQLQAGKPIALKVSPPSRQSGSGKPDPRMALAMALGGSPRNREKEPDKAPELEHKTLDRPRVSKHKRPPRKHRFHSGQSGRSRSPSNSRTSTRSNTEQPAEQDTEEEVSETKQPTTKSSSDEEADSPPQKKPPIPAGAPPAKASPPVPKASPKAVPKSSPPVPKASPPVPKASPPVPKASPPVPKASPPKPSGAAPPKSKPPLPSGEPPVPAAGKKKKPPLPSGEPPQPKAKKPPLPDGAPPTKSGPPPIPAGANPKSPKKVPPPIPSNPPNIEEDEEPSADPVGEEEPAEGETPQKKRFAGIGKSVMPMPDLKAGFPLKKSKRSSAEAPKPAPAADDEIPTCNNCGCNDYQKNPFKKKWHCNNCFHNHTA